MVLSVVSQNNNNYKTELKSIINVIKHVTVLGIYAEYRPLNTVENWNVVRVVFIKSAKSRHLSWKTKPIKKKKKRHFLETVSGHFSAVIVESVYTKSIEANVKI